MKFLTNEQQKYVKMQKFVLMVKENLKINTIKKYYKVRDHCHYTGEYRGAAHSICNLKYSLLKEIPLVCHDRSNCDYHFVIKGLLEEFEEHLTCFGENTE